MQNRKRNRAVTLRMTEEEFAFFQKQMATSKQKNQTDFFLEVLRNREIIVIENIQPTLAELTRQGNNLNQLTRRLNEGSELGKIAKVVLEKCWQAYEGLLSMKEKRR